jgi:ABC-type lipoprotein export system ATPase subunit
MTSPLLTLDGVSKSYRRGLRSLHVLRAVSLEVAAGQVFGVYGPRRAGKTTLLRLAAGFERPDEGRVAFAGVDLSRLSRTKLARLHRTSIAWVEREGPHTRDLCVLDYIALPLYGPFSPIEARRRALAALERVGAVDSAEQSWDRLTDTSRTLASIAQALVRQPRLLLVDDPTGGLNVIDRERVVGLLRSAAEEDGCGVLMAVPDLPAMHHAHEIRALSRGRLIAPSERAQRDDGPGATIVEFPHSQRSA